MKKIITSIVFIACLLCLSSGQQTVNSTGNGYPGSPYVPAAGGPMEIVFSFDTTGSMYPVIEQVRSHVADMIKRLQSDIPGIRIAVFAHGDYSDARNKYLTKHIDFSTDVQALQQFVRTVGRTGGGDAPEAYEAVLYEVGNDLSWTPGSYRSLVMIGDENPQPPRISAHKYSRGRIDWKQESKNLNIKGVRIYSIQALNKDHASDFYETMSSNTGGYHLRLDNFASIFDFIMAISYREYGIQYLQAYEDEVRSRPEGISKELENLFETLKKQPDRIAATPDPNATTIPTTSVEVSTTSAPYKEPDMHIDHMHIRSKIAYRFATTSITSRIKNPKNYSQEAQFSVRLPKNAFISEFWMEIDGQIYPGEVKEKEAARKKYNAAKKKKVPTATLR